MAARQQHGFDFENTSILTYGWQDAKSQDLKNWYTAPFDAFCPNFKIPVSIKTAKEKSPIELGDFKRQSEHNTDFIMCVGLWSGKEKTIHTEYLLKIPSSYWIAQFENSPVDIILTAFDGITNSYEDDKKWTERRKALTKLWNDSGSDIRVNFKRDHKKQKRIQCSIPWKTFYNTLLPKFEIK